MTDTAPLMLVIDDDPSVRTAVSRLLKAAGFGAQGFPSADAFLRQPLPDGPACVVLDVCLPGLSGPDLQRALAERCATLPIVFITGHGDIPTAVQAMKAGAVDFLPKPFDDQNLLAAIRQALARQALSLREAREVAEVRRHAETLSPREREVLALVVTGLLNKQVGCKLGVSEKTVKVHRAQVMRKMQADSLAALVRLAEKLGLPSAPSSEARCDH